MSAPTIERPIATLDPTMTARHLRRNQLNVERHIPDCAIILMGEMDGRGMPIAETVQPYLLDSNNELHPAEFVPSTAAGIAIANS